MSCGYSPIYQTNQKLNFKLDLINFSGDKKVGREIVKNIEELRKNKSENILNISFETLKTESIVTKDKKGNASSYKLSLKVDLDLVNKNTDKKFSKSFLKETTYNSMDNKFELKQYKTNLEKNMVSQILQDINIFFDTIQDDL
tara:strand:+ start:3445 stop:3873 length:429 start_codon:yes stop_codon:yes gene_type:complete